jgi:hypothetical protein
VCPSHPSAARAHEGGHVAGSAGVRRLGPAGQVCAQHMARAHEDSVSRVRACAVVYWLWLADGLVPRTRACDAPHPGGVSCASAAPLVRCRLLASVMPAAVAGVCGGVAPVLRPTVVMDEPPSPHSRKAGGGSTTRYAAVESTSHVCFVPVCRVVLHAISGVA